MNQTAKPAQRLPANTNSGLATLLSYGAANAGGCVVFATINSLITLFYTDYADISPAMVATVLLISRFLDGLSDLAAGFIIQRTRTAAGQARPWILRMALPMAISCVAIVCVPQGSDTLKFWYMFISYNFASTICFTLSDLAQNTMCSLMSKDPKEREKLSRWRMGICPIGHILSAGCSLPLVKVFGNNQSAWIKVMAIWGVFAFLGHIACYVFCKETVSTETVGTAKRPPLRQQLHALLTNQYFWWLLAFWTIWASYFGVTGTTMSYYTRYILGNDYLYTVFFIAEKLIWGVGMLALVPILRERLKIKLRQLWVTGCILPVAGHVMVSIAPYSLGINLMAVVLRGVGASFLGAFVSSMIADCAEFGQWKNHQRQEALICSTASMGSKVGGGVLLSMVTGLLGVAGFVTSTTGGAVQPESALIMIKNLYIWAPAVIFFALAITCWCFRLEEKMPAIAKELSEREARGEL